MKKQNQPVCTGCGRHCTADTVRCKYGRAYFARLSEETTEKTIRPKHKWEKSVAHGGLMWHLLAVSHRTKKALRSDETSEMRLLGALDESEQAQLLRILRKLSACLE